MNISPAPDQCLRRAPRRWPAEPGARPRDLRGPLHLVTPAVARAGSPMFHLEEA